MGKPVRVGIIDCGKIAGQYLESFRRLDDVILVAVADIDPVRAQAVAADVGEGVRAVLDAARTAGVVVGCAPDTVLGTGIQTARKAIDDGRIGAPVAATATMLTPGHERWHPDPDFYYQPGGGPLLDMGPYYISALVTLLGPVSSVIGAASAGRSERTIGSGPREGQTVPVDIDTHVTGILRTSRGNSKQGQSPARCRARGPRQARCRCQVLSARPRGDSTFRLIRIPQAAPKLVKCLPWTHRPPPRVPPSCGSCG